MHGRFVSQTLLRNPFLFQPYEVSARAVFPLFFAHPVRGDINSGRALIVPPGMQQSNSELQLPVCRVQSFPHGIQETLLRYESLCVSSLWKIVQWHAHVMQRDRAKQSVLASKFGARTRMVCASSM